MVLGSDVPLTEDILFKKPNVNEPLSNFLLQNQLEFVHRRASSISTVVTTIFTVPANNIFYFLGYSISGYKITGAATELISLITRQGGATTKNIGGLRCFNIGVPVSVSQDFTVPTILEPGVSLGVVSATNNVEGYCQINGILIKKPII